MGRETPANGIQASRSCSPMVFFWISLLVDLVGVAAVFAAAASVAIRSKISSGRRLRVSQMEGDAHRDGGVQATQTSAGCSSVIPWQQNEVLVTSLRYQCSCCPASPHFCHGGSKGAANCSCKHWSLGGKRVWWRRKRSSQIQNPVH